MATQAVTTIDQDTNINNSVSTRILDSYNTNISRTFAPHYSDLGSAQVTFPGATANMGGSGGGTESGFSLSKVKQYLPALLLAVAVYWILFRRNS